MRMTLTRLRALMLLSEYSRADAEDLADAIFSADDPTHVNQARRIARGLAEHGMVRELRSGEFKITALGKQATLHWSIS